MDRTRSAARTPAGRPRPRVRLSGPGAAHIAAIAGAVPDPELPMVSLANLGVLRSVDVDGPTGHVTVTITPTYSGCPALQMMSDDVRRRLAGAGYRDVTVERVLATAWSSDDLTARAHRALLDAGIAPPAHRSSESTSSESSSPETASFETTSPETTSPEIACPHCGSGNTEQLSRFGSTSCKALYRCLACREPFDYFKVH